VFVESYVLKLTSVRNMPLQPGQADTRELSSFGSTRRRGGIFHFASAPPGTRIQIRIDYATATTHISSPRISWRPRWIAGVPRFGMSWASYSSDSSFPSDFYYEYNEGDAYTRDEQIWAVMREVTDGRTDELRIEYWFGDWATEFDTEFGNEGADSVAFSLRDCPNLKTLALTHNRIGDEGFVTLLDSLRACPELLVLEVYVNDIRDAGAAALAEFLRVSASLQKLDLSKNTFATSGATALAEGISACPSLRDLIMNGCMQLLEAGTTLARGLRGCTNLRTLDLSGNAFDNAGFALLAENIRACAILETLKLSYCAIGDARAASLAGGIRACHSLQTLMLRNNFLGNLGASVLVESLQLCPKLEYLDLCNNRIGGGTGVASIVEFMRVCPSLKSLDLSGSNLIDDAGLRALVSSAPICPNLQNLFLQDDVTAHHETQMTEFFEGSSKHVCRVARRHDAWCGATASSGLVVPQFPSAKRQAFSRSHLRFCCKLRLMCACRLRTPRPTLCSSYWMRNKFGNSSSRRIGSATTARRRKNVPAESADVRKTQTMAKKVARETAVETTETLSARSARRSRERRATLMTSLLAF
jgi:Ran GTPase-activating protein (RanGAP) involved in mRNA processing and transport